MVRENNPTTNETCVKTGGLERYTDLLFNNEEGTVVFNRWILVGDLITLSGDNWLSLALIQGYVDLLNNNSHHRTKTFILNNLIGMHNNQLLELMYEHEKTYVSFIVHVGRTEEGTFVSSYNKRGCYWSLLCIDINSNKWYYIDTLGWKPPDDLTSKVNSILEGFSLEGKSLAQTQIVAHKVGNTDNHHCDHGCLPNIPLQTCSSVCGVSVVIIARIASLNPTLWKSAFLSPGADPLPRYMKWLIRPTKHRLYLRRVLIDWMMSDNINLCLVGLHDLCDHVEFYNEDTDDDESFKVGMEFQSYHEVKRAKHNFFKKSTNIYTRHSRSLRSYTRRCPKKNTNQALMFSELEYSCVHGGNALRPPQEANNQIKAHFKWDVQC